MNIKRHRNGEHPQDQNDDGNFFLRTSSGLGASCRNGTNIWRGLDAIEGARGLGECRGVEFRDEGLESVLATEQVSDGGYRSGEMPSER